jgi:ABC-type nitrate/sulfonate/bicarbonate transport system permease component
VLDVATVVNGAAGSRHSAGLLERRQVLRLSGFTTFIRIVIPATLMPLTGYRLSLGIAWLVSWPARC